MVEVLAIDIEIIQKLVKKSEFMQEFLWSESLYAMSRFYVKEMKPLGQLEKDTISKLMPFLGY